MSRFKEVKREIGTISYLGYEFRFIEPTTQDMIDLGEIDRLPTSDQLPMMVDFFKRLYQGDDELDFVEFLKKLPLSKFTKLAEVIVTSFTESDEKK